ncbi:MAG TPA: hypothetical protein VEY91_07635 [Candidatus Limnocylindria bacterium]|nr:hypothetical protein [Candidatus Limnocylindria bacterium]
MVLASSIVALMAVGFVGVAWNDRADGICREQAPATASRYTLTWEWSEFAYVCDYRTPDTQPKRVGIIDAFHGEGRQRHRPDR